MEKFTLRWKHENIHVINETKKMSNQVLHVHLEPLSKLPAGFAVKLIVRYCLIEARREEGCGSRKGNTNGHRHKWRAKIGYLSREAWD